MRITDVPEFHDTDDLVILPPDTLVSMAAARLKKDNLGAAVIVKGKKLVGIMTERDIMNKIVAANKDYKTMTVDKIMTKNVQTATLEEGVPSAMLKMSKGNFRHLPVVDDAGHPIGMMSQDDFVALTWDQVWKRLKGKTRNSFFSFTQVWMMALTYFLYIATTIVIIYIMLAFTQ